MRSIYRDTHARAPAMRGGSALCSFILKMPRLKFLGCEAPIPRCADGRASFARSARRHSGRGGIPDGRASARDRNFQTFPAARRPPPAARNSIHVKVTTCTSRLSGRVHALPSNFRELPSHASSPPPLAVPVGLSIGGEGHGLFADRIHAGTGGGLEIRAIARCRINPRDESSRLPVCLVCPVSNLMKVGPTENYGFAALDSQASRSIAPRSMSPAVTLTSAISRQ
jgi:hypothetical protein